MSKDAHKRQTFLDQYVNGEILAEEIDDYVDSWHAESRDEPIYQFLGLSRGEYSLWLRDPQTLPYIALARRTQKPLALILDSQLSQMPIAARSADIARVKRLRLWLVQHGKID